MTLENIKTPRQLLEYMCDNIKYGFVDEENRVYCPKPNEEIFQKMHKEKWRLSSPQRLKEMRYGTCFDTVELERDWFLKHGYKVKTFFILFCLPYPNSYSLHTYLVYEEKGKYYYFEYADSKNRGIYSFPHLKEAIAYQRNNHIASNKERNPVGEKELQCLQIYEYATPPMGCTFEEFIDFILEKGEKVDV